MSKSIAKWGFGVKAQDIQVTVIKKQMPFLNSICFLNALNEFFANL
jgi:hypothetical protein